VWIQGYCLSVPATCEDLPLWMMTVPTASTSNKWTRSSLPSHAASTGMRIEPAKHAETDEKARAQVGMIGEVQHSCLSRSKIEASACGIAKRTRGRSSTDPVVAEEQGFLILSPWLAQWSIGVHFSCSLWQLEP
jgi:hypothetical protein